MKKNLPIICFLLISLNLFAQTKDRNGDVISGNNSGKVSNGKIDSAKTYVITYDFKKGEYVKALLRPKVDRPIVYKITNINRLAFDVQVNPKDIVVAETDWFTSSEELIKITALVSEPKSTAQAKTEGSISLPEVSADKAIKSELKDEVRSIQKLDSLTIAKSTLTSKIEELQKSKNEQSNLKIFFKDTLDDGKIKNIDSLIGTEKKSLQEIDKQIENIKTLKNEKLANFQNVKDEFNKSYDEFNKTYAKINTIVQAANRVIPISNMPFLKREEYSNLYQTDFRIIFLKLNAIDITSSTLNKQYNELVLKYNNLKNIEDLDKIFDKTSLKKYFNDIDIMFDDAKKIRLKAELIDFEKLSQQVQRIINLLEKEETYEYVSAPVQPKNDLATFEVEIKAKNKDVEVNNSRKFIHSEFVKGGTRIDFSIGLAGSYFPKINSYEIYTIAGQNKIGLKSTNLTVPSLVTMLTMTNRGSKYGAIGGSAGLGIDVNNGKIQISNFFVGPTLILGKYDRIMFTSGVTLRNVGKLKNGYLLDETVITQSSDINSVLSDNYKVGLFIALTYNLTNSVRKKISDYK